MMTEAVGAGSRRADPWGPRRWGPTRGGPIRGGRGGGGPARAGSICGSEPIYLETERTAKSWHQIIDQAIIIRNESNQKATTQTSKQVR